MKNVSRHQHDKNRNSSIVTVKSYFALIGARQHCVILLVSTSHVAIFVRWLLGWCYISSAEIEHKNQNRSLFKLVVREA